MNPAQHAVILLLRVYQRVLSPTLRGIFGPAGECRFTPSCSQYAREAVQIHGVILGGAFAARRLCRCHPWGGCGDDPVPERKCAMQTPKLKLPDGDSRPAAAGRN